MSRIFAIFVFCIFFSGLQNEAKAKVLAINLDSIEAKVSLVLSGGGARGFAQVGVLKVIEKAKIPIHSVVGTSIGAIIGGFYATGYTPQEMEDIIKNENWAEIFSLNDGKPRIDLFFDQKQISDRNIFTLRFNDFDFDFPESISIGNKLSDFLQDKIWNSRYYSSNFDSLRFVYRAIAADIASGKSVALSSGELAKCIRASATIPLRYAPVKIDSMVLVDGGLWGNIPVEDALLLKPDIVIVVNSVSPLLQTEELTTPWNIADQVVSIMMKSFSDSSLVKSDFIILPKIGNRKNDDFSNIDSLISAGENETKLHIDRISNAVRQFKINRILELMKQNFYLNLDYNEILNQVFYLEQNSQYKAYKIEEITNKVLENKDIKYLDFELSNDSLFLHLNKDHLLKSIKITPEFFSINEILNKDLNEKYKNRVYSLDLKNSIISHIYQSYSKAAFNFAKIQSINYNDDNQLEINILPRTVKKIKINGKDISSNFIVERELTFNSGQSISAAQCLQSWKNLISTELFKDVAIEFENEDNEGFDINIIATPQGSHLVKVGGRADDERNTQIGIDFIKENILNLGFRWNLRAVYGNRNLFFAFHHENPRIQNSYFGYKLSAYYNKSNIFFYENRLGLPINRYEKLQVSESANERYGASFNIGTQLEKLGKIELIYRIEKQRLYDLKESDLPDYFDLSTFKISSTLDNEDDLYFPKSGSYLNMYLESGGFSATSIGFSKAYFHYRTNQSYGMHTFTPSFRFGMGDATMPSTEFYSIGGQNSFLGMREDENRGRQIFKTSLEYRANLPFDIIFDTYLGFRYDLGATWENPDAIKFSTLRHGLGFNLSLDTPIGPSVFSIGRAFYFLDKPDIVLSDIKIYFSIGTSLY